MYWDTVLHSLRLAQNARLYMREAHAPLTLSEGPGPTTDAKTDAHIPAVRATAQKSHYSN